MRHKDGTYDLTIDDIHEIRVETSEKLERMSDDEIIEFFKEALRKFNERKEQSLQLV